MATAQIHDNVKNFNDTRRALAQLQIQVNQISGGSAASVTSVATATKKETRFTFLATGSPVTI